MNEPNVVQKFIWIGERAILLLIAVATLFATASEIVRIIEVETVNLSDLFLLFIYAEVLGMVASFYANNRIPVTLPLIIDCTCPIPQSLLFGLKTLSPGSKSKII